MWPDAKGADVRLSAGFRHIWQRPEMRRHKKKLIFVALAIIPIAAVLFFYSHSGNAAPVVAGNYPKFTESQLTPFDGTDPNKPIYIGLNGYVYDVSAGKKFYIVGGDYHYLAGKDSSADLNFIGGDIIKRKYPVVGVLVK